MLFTRGAGGVLLAFVKKPVNELWEAWRSIVFFSFFFSTNGDDTARKRFCYGV
jgi:hypothetical protein